jgi:hypothetical protein
MTVLITIRLPREPHQPVTYLEVPANPPMGSKGDWRIGDKGPPTMNLPKGLSSSASEALPPPPTRPSLTLGGTSAAPTMIKPIPFQVDRRNPALESWLTNGMAGGSKKTAEQELDEAQWLVKELTMELASMDATLDPCRRREDEIRDAIRRTHWNVGGVIHLDMTRAAQRKPLFVELLAMSEQWGELRSERKRTDREIKLLKKHIGRMQAQIEREAKKRSRGHGKG